MNAKLHRMKQDLPSVAKEINATLKILENIEWLSCGPDFIEKVLRKEFEDHQVTDQTKPTGSNTNPAHNPSHFDDWSQTGSEFNVDREEWPGFW